MQKEQILSLIGVAIFLIVTTVTYGIVTPVKQSTTNSSLITVTNEITNATNDTSNTTAATTRLTKDYQIMTAIVSGIVIAIVGVFILGYWK